MKLEHVNLVVSDINAMLKFYQAVFPYWSITSGGEGETATYQDIKLVWHTLPM